MRLKDARIKLMNQILSGMKVLKLYAWEAYFEQKILSIRNDELVVLKKAALLSTVNYIVSFSSTFIVSVYLLYSDSGQYRAQRIFIIYHRKIAFS